MPTVTMPQLGESVEEGTIGKWLKNVGDHVRVGDPLVEVVTDKVNAEVPSPFEGTLTQIHVAEGDTVANDAAIAEVEADGAGAKPEAKAASEEAGAAAAAVQQAPEAEPAEQATEAARQAGAGGKAEARATDAGGTPAPDQPTASPGTRVATVDVEVQAGAPAGPAQPGAGNGAHGASVEIPAGARMTPAVRRLIRETGADVSAIVGSGAGGRITREDVEKAVAAGHVAQGEAPSAAARADQLPAPEAGKAQVPAADGPAAQPGSPVAEGDSLKRLSPMRKAIAAQMTRSLEVPTAYITIEVDMTPVVRRRNAINADYKAREGMSLSYVAFVTKACVEALRKHHDINAHWTDEGHWRRKDINIGIAVAVPDGLVVPVIFNADRLSLHGLNAAINDLASRARNKKLKPDEMRGSTFTVDNTGWTGSILTLPIINVPEVAIITMEKVVKRPVVLEDQGDAIAVRSMMNMCIAIDHRATDGAQAGEFLADVRRWLESVDGDTPIW